MNGSDPKQIARELLEEAHPALIGLSHWIHANPELGYQEVLASGWVTEWLTTAGFDVRTGVAGMPTAVVGSYGPGPFHIAVCVEYDALPAVGHACGHNVIAAAGVGAGLALAAVADQLGLRVTVLGTPAEETGGGKIGLIKAGELDGVHAAMMVHPWPQDEATPSILAIRSLNVTYTGKEAHAAGFPYLGVNAGDALVVAQTAIALLRQQLRSTDRVHGIVTKGGDAPNIIPARTEAQWMVRGTNVARLDEVTALVRRCFEAGALATGATLHIQEEICYADVRHDPDLSRLYQANAEQLGRTVSPASMPVSTDMGNVSYVVPTIHPMIGIEANGAVNHQVAFAAACATPSADQAIFDGALAMAWTAIDAAQDVALRDRLMAFVPDQAEVAMVSQAWMMPPFGVALAAAEVPAEVDVVDADDDGMPDPMAEAGLDPDASWADAPDTVAVSELAFETIDEVAPTDPADAAWTMDTLAVALAVAGMDAPPTDDAGAEALADPEAVAAVGDPEAQAAADSELVAALEASADPDVVAVADPEAAAEPGLVAEPEPDAVAADAWSAGPDTVAETAWTATGDAAPEPEAVAETAWTASGDAAPVPELVAESEAVTTVDSWSTEPEAIAAEAWSTEAEAVAVEDAPAATSWATDGVADAEPAADPDPVSEGELAWGAAALAAVARPVAEDAPGPDDEWAAAGWVSEPAPPPTGAVEPVAAVDPDEELDQDAAWARDVDAVAQQIAAAGLMARADPAAGAAPVEADPDDVLFVGFDDAAAEVVLLDAAEPAVEAPPATTEPEPEPVLDVWVTPEVLGEWLEAPAEVVAAAEATHAGPSAMDGNPADAHPADAWFAMEAPAPVASTAAPVPVATPAAAVPAAATPMDRDAWDRAFEDAATRIGWEQQFEDAVRERMTDEGMDRSEAIEDLAADLQEAADDRSDTVTAAPAWPPQASELVSREHIEAEGFSFVAPDVSSHREELGDVWSRNGADHAAEDLRLS